jgi:hypothetical protein
MPVMIRLPHWVLFRSRCSSNLALARPARQDLGHPFKEGQTDR